MIRRIVQVKQNSREWVEWRGKGLGASDAPIVMGDSPWTSRFQLWAEKTGILLRPESNVYQLTAMQRGHDLEPKVREMYESQVGKKFSSASFEHAQYSFLRCSLDGFNEELNKNLEIKCPGKVDHESATKGRVPKKYMPQLQMQMLVSGTTSTDYVSWDGKGEIIVITVLPDIGYQDKLLKEMLAFWHLIQTKIPPKIGPDEVLSVLAVVKADFDKIGKSFKALSLVCEAITKGETNDH